MYHKERDALSASLQLYINKCPALSQVPDILCYRFYLNIINCRLTLSEPIYRMQ